MDLGKVCVSCINWIASSLGRAKSWFRLHNQCVHTCREVGVRVSAEERPRVEVCAACPESRVCKRGHNARAGWLGLLGAGRASMAAKDLHYDGNRRFTVFLSERTAGRILTERKQKGLCDSGDARLAAVSPLWNCPHSKSHWNLGITHC